MTYRRVLAALPRPNWVGSSLIVRRLVIIDLVALLVLGSMYLLDNRLAPAAAHTYQAQVQALRAEMRQASTLGYTARDLAPARERIQQIERPMPSWLPNQWWWYRQQTTAIQGLRRWLPPYLSSLAQRERRSIERWLRSAQLVTADDEQLGVNATTMQHLTSDASQIATQRSTKNMARLRRLDAEAAQLVDWARASGIAQRQENTSIQQAATALTTQASGDVDAMRTAGTTSLTAGRNDATVAAYEAKAGRFPKIDALMLAYDRMETALPRLNGVSPDQVAFGAAAMQRYAGQIHDLLIQGMGPKHVVVSFEAQHVWAYENGQVVMENAVTTGVRGDTDYGTDFGPMKIVVRSHPWTMTSPWPPGNPLYYPPTVVQWTAFFTTSGESFHDASWEPDSELGPGSQYDPSTRSHGCIHLPYDKAQWMFEWTQLGTPVDVIPGNGQPVSEQLSEMTTDNHGNPKVPA